MADNTFPSTMRSGGLESQSNIIASTIQRQDALVRKNSDDRPRLQLRMVIPLDAAATVANPFQISDPFDGYYVENTTDALTNVQMAFTSREQSNMLNFTTISQKDSAKFDEPIRGALITWAAQAGKTITLILYLGIDFRPGSYLSVTSGSVTTGFGTQMSPNACQAVTGTSSKIVPANSLRKRATITNLSGGTVYLSGLSTVVGASGLVVGTTLVGIPVLAGGTYEWLNSGDIYAITDSGTSVVALNLES